MMASRWYVFVVVWLLGWVVSRGFGQQPTPPEGAVEPEQSTAAPKPPPDGEKTAEQVVRAAMDALDRLDSAEFDEPRQTALAEISDRIGDVQNHDPNNSMLPYLYGWAYALSGRKGEAVDQLQRFVETREGRREWRAFRILGDLFVEQYPQLAKANYENAAALKADEPAVLFGLARCAAKLGRSAEAIRLARDAIAADRRSGPAGIRGRSLLATMLSADRRWGEAQREAEAAVRLAEESVRRYPGKRRPVEVLRQQYELLTGILRVRITEKDAGAEEYSLFMKYVRGQSEIAALLSLHDALDILESAVAKTAPDTPPRLMEQHAVVLAEIGRRDEALAVFEKLLQAEPDNAVARDWLERLRGESTRPEPRSTTPTAPVP